MVASAIKLKLSVKCSDGMSDKFVVETATSTFVVMSAISEWTVVRFQADVSGSNYGPSQPHHLSCWSDCLLEDGKTVS